MFLERANYHANEILAVLGKHKTTLKKIKKFKRPLSPESMSAINGLDAEAPFLKEQIHLFAFQCKQDRPSTELLAQGLYGQLSGCLWQLGELRSKLKQKRPQNFSDQLFYLQDLEELLHYCSHQLYFELNWNFASFPQVATGTLPIATGTFPARQPEIWTSVQPSPSAISTPEASLQPELLEIPQPRLFSAGDTLDSPKEEAPDTPSEGFPSEIISKLGQELEGKEMESLVKDFLKHVEKMIASSIQPKKKGRPGKNHPLTFHEIVHVVLAANLDLLLIKSLGSKRTYDFLAFLGGGNDKDAALYIRDFRKDQNDPSRDPKYNLEGQHEELMERAIKIIGSRLPRAIERYVSEDYF